jgi:hypothetical protein
MKSVITCGSGTSRDIDYDFENQTFQLVDPHVELRPATC